MGQKKIKKNDEVEITRGPYARLRGIVREVNKDKTLIVELSFKSGTVKVEARDVRRQKKRRDF